MIRYSILLQQYQTDNTQYNITEYCIIIWAGYGMLQVLLQYKQTSKGNIIGDIRHAAFERENVNECDAS